MQGDALSAIVTVDPDPPVVGNGQVAIRLRDDEGTPVTGATIVISPWMPAHGHGTSDVQATEGDDGEYRAENVRFHMVGEWELRMLVTTKDGVQDELVATVQVQ